MSKMLSSKHILTILVTIVIAITYKPCVSINNVNKVNRIKLSFLQKDADNQDTPESVKSGETVDVVSNKDVGAGGGATKDSSVDSHTETKEVDKHEQDKAVGEPAKKEEEQGGGAKNESEDAGSEEKKPTGDAEGSKSADNDSHVDAGTGGAKADTGKHEHEEHEAEDSSTHKDNEGAKEEHKESGEQENHQESPDGGHKPGGQVESKQTEAEGHTHSQVEHNRGEEADATKGEGVAVHNQATSDAQTGGVAGSPEGAPSKEAAPDQTGASNDGGKGGQEDKHATETQQADTHVVGEAHPHQPAGTPEATHLAAPAPTQPSESTQNVVKDHVQPAADTSHAAPETGASVAQQGNNTQAPTNTQTAPNPVDLASLTDEEKKRVVDFWKKASGDCSVDCTHSCRSELQGATQCVSVTNNSLSCSTFGDSATLTCPEGYTPCTQPVVTSLKSYTVKNNGVEVGALEVDGSNFSKCMGLALTTPDGRCDKANLVANLLFTAGALNLDYETNVAADKLTFSDLRIKNGDYKVCIFQRYEGNPEGMTISNILTKLMDFINPTSSTPNQTRTVFVMEVGTLKVSD
ncbi:conserved hypothetical protein [Theileria orientalis strain Shintoku]|uniref:Uncharacterized protein n=1 Tax=Theileria orientalis strain Shintoku TaxID=869250 RepID=J4DNV0_THEOR|nr:conserved hypothetical protein [Theileria orientalis strain Shintoku]BAM39594.1 conserved hypothetical protein [Theileria orientalis strain Shintoku]|eukprot:XP_009689895.1 conserved hypothetical protein [Theileria orientalis strain Shintoku]